MLYNLTLVALAVTVMQEWVDVRHMGTDRDIHPWEDMHLHSQPLRAAFHPSYQSSNEPFLCQNFKINYQVVQSGNHGTERIKLLPEYLPTFNKHNPAKAR